MENVRVGSTVTRALEHWFGGLWSSRRSVCALTALALLCWGLQLSGGRYNPFALDVLLVAVVVLALAWFLPPSVGHHRSIVGLALPVLVFELYETYFEDSRHAIGVTVLAVPLLTLLLTTLYARRGRWIAAVAAAALVVALLLWNVAPYWGRFGIDVLTVQQQAGAAILAGHNPYRGIDMLYFPVGATGSVMVAGHFAYGPTVAFVDAAVRWLGDVRLADVLAYCVLAVSVVALAAARGRAAAFIALVLVAALPLTVYMVLHGWVDMITMAAFAAWVALRRHDHRVLSVIALAVGVCAKPTVLILMVPYVVWSRRCRREFAGVAAISVAILLPFLVTVGPGALWDDIVGVELRLPVRYDSLGINAWLLHGGKAPLPLLFSCLVVVVPFVLIMVRRPRGEADLLLGAALLTMTTYLVAKWAFYDYYFDVAILLVMAVAAGSLGLAGNELPSRPRLPSALTRGRASPAYRLPT